MSEGNKYAPPQMNVPEQFPELVKELTKEVLRHQPKDLVQFCAEHFQGKLEERATGVAKKPTGRQPPTAASVAAARLHDKGNDTYEDSEEEDNNFPSNPPPAVPVAAVSHNRGRRASVSAESMTPTADEKYEKIIIPKTEEQRKRIYAAIQNNFLFKNLDEDQYKEVVDAMSEKPAKAGDNVIVQGSQGDFFYVVEHGLLEVHVLRAGQDKPAKVAEYEDGGSFGELALMYNAPRAATVKASTDCILWALDRVTFRRILMENTSKKRRMYEAFLEELDFLKSLEPYEKHKIADALESVTFNNGEIVVRQGDIGDNFYIIEQGEAAITHIDHNGTVQHLPGLTKGKYFGELALLEDAPRKVTVTAVGKLKCATLGKKAFVRLLGPVKDILSRNTAQYTKIDDDKK